MIQRTIHWGIHDFFVLLLLLMTLLCITPAALAAPKTGWVDLQAQVPDGFKGSVSVALEHKQTGETQIVTCYSLNDYANSVQIPLGEYTVVSAFTSEDSFIYEASTKTEQFILKDGVDIEVTVTHNPEGEGILAGIAQGTEETTFTPSDEPSAETEPLPEQEPDPSAPEDEEPEVRDKPEENENPPDTTATIIRNILLTVVATLAFLGGTVLIVLYIRMKFGSD